MQRTIRIVPFLLLALFLAACGGSDDAAENPSSNVAQAAESSQTSESNTTTVRNPSNGEGRLGMNYTDALPASTQLVFGSLQLKETDQAIDETLAAEILPLWQAYRALSNADTTAQAELDAVINQIQDTMQPEQIQAIAALQLTSEGAQALLQEQGVRFGRGFGGDNTGDAAGGGGFPGGGGRLPGGGPRGGGLPGQGPGGQVDPEARATAIAERFGGDNTGAFLERGMLNALIRSLQVKTGERDESELQNRGGFFARLLQPASDASGVDVEILQAGMEEDKSLAEVITDNGGDLDAGKDAMRALFAEQGLEGEALDQRVNGFFNGATQ